jgi:hypothetical protein
MAMTYGFIQPPDPKAATEAPGVVSNEPGLKVSKVGSLKQFVPQMFEQLVGIANLMGVMPRLLAGDFDTMDIETTGMKRSRCTIWQIAISRFRNFDQIDTLDRVVAISEQDVLDAYRESPNPEDVKRRMHLTWERIQSQGRPPAEVITAVRDYVNMDTSVPIVGYASRHIDIPFLQLFCAAHAPGLPLPIPLERLLDLGMAVKGAQLGTRINPGETAVDYMSRVSGLPAAKIYWSVDYVLGQLGLGIREELLHDARIDSLAAGMILNYILKQGLPDDRLRYWQEKINA